MTIGCAGSSPAPGTFLENPVQHIIARIAQLVEHDLAKVGVASPSLVSRSELVERSFLFEQRCITMRE